MLVDLFIYLFIDWLAVS